LLGYAVASHPLLWKHLDLSQMPRDCCANGLPPTLVARLESSTSLTLAGRIDIPSTIFKSIITIASSSPRLTSLTLCNAIDVNEDMLIDMFRNTRGSLTDVDLSFCHHLGSDTILALVNNHRSLRTLNLSYTSITDEALLTLHQFHNLTDLSLKGCFNLTCASMSQFLQNSLPPRLSRLNLSYLFTVLGEWLAASSVKFEHLDVRHVENITKRDIRGFRERWGTGCEVLTTARLEADDERGWTQYVDEIIRAEAVY
jgi:hypothetical protein